MISSLDVNDQKMPAHLGGPHPEEDPDPLFDEDLAHLFVGADLQEGGVDLFEEGVYNITLYFCK